jgi:putative ABC transport system permease protein
VARQLFPDQDPIGQRIDCIDYAPTWREIVGVVGDVQLDRGAVGLGGLDMGGGTSSPSLIFKLQGYVPLAQLPWATQTLVVRSAGDLRRLAGEREIRRAIHEVDGDQAITSIRPVTEMVARSMARERFALLVFAVFSGVALLLAAVGVYGVMSYVVAQRTGEIGIRMALGARRGQVLGLVLAQGARMIVGGVAAGLAGAWLLTRFLGSVLYGVGARDPLTFIAIAALLALAAALACLLAAHRATRVDPMTALRAE